MSRIDGLTNREINAVKQQIRRMTGPVRPTDAEVEAYVRETSDRALLLVPGIGKVGIKRLRAKWPYAPMPAMRADDV